MIETREQRLVAGTLHDRMVPVPADVEERAQRVISAAHEHHGDARHFAREVVARLRNLSRTADVFPSASEDVPTLELEDVTVGVPRRWQRAACVCSGRDCFEIEGGHVRQVRCVRLYTTV